MLAPGSGGGPDPGLGATVAWGWSGTPRQGIWRLVRQAGPCRDQAAAEGAAQGPAGGPATVAPEVLGLDAEVLTAQARGFCRDQGMHGALLELMSEWAPGGAACGEATVTTWKRSARLRHRRRTSSSSARGLAVDAPGAAGGSTSRRGAEIDGTGHSGCDEVNVLHRSLTSPQMGCRTAPPRVVVARR